MYYSYTEDYSYNVVIGAFVISRIITRLEGRGAGREKDGGRGRGGGRGTESPINQAMVIIKFTRPRSGLFVEGQANWLPEECNFDR